MCARAQCAARERVDWGQVPTRRHAWLPSDIGGPQVALGRAGDGPKVFPWWEAALVALCGARGGDLRSPTFPRLAPPRLWLGLAPRSSAGPNFERFLERCPLDSKFSCDNIWVSKCMLFLRSSNVFDGWLDLPPPGHALYCSESECNHSACTIAVLAKPKAGKALLDHLLRAPPLEPLRHKLQPSEAAPTRRVMSVRRARGLGVGLGVRVRVGVGERYRNGGARKDVRLAAATLPPPSFAIPIAPAASVTPPWP